MKSFLKFLKDLFIIGVIGFGGGTSLIPLLEKAYVKNGLTIDEFNQDTAIACMTPGALPVQIVTGGGKRIMGRIGMVISPIVLAAPGVIFCVIIYLILGTVDESFEKILKIISSIISLYIIYLLIRYICNVFKRADKKYLIKYIIIAFIVASITSYGKLISFFNISSLPKISISSSLVVLLFFIILLIHSLLFSKKTDSEAMKESTDYAIKKTFKIDVQNLFKNIFCWIIFVILFTLPACILLTLNYKVLNLDSPFIKILDLLLLECKTFLSTFLSFGGGDAYLGIAESTFVDSGIIGSDIFYKTIVNVINLVPGSILCKCSSSIGYFVGLEIGKELLAVTYTLSLFSVGVAGSGCCFIIVSELYNSIKDSELLNNLLTYIKPVMAGIMVSVVISLLLNVLH